MSMAQWSVKLPALLALVATQVGLLASQVRQLASRHQIAGVCISSNTPQQTTAMSASSVLAGRTNSAMVHAHAEFAVFVLQTS